MLATLLLAGIIAAPLGSIALLLPVRTPAGRAGVWSATRRFVLAIVGTVVLVALVAVVLKFLLGVNRHNLIVGVAGVTVASGLAGSRGHAGQTTPYRGKQRMVAPVMVTTVHRELR